MLEDYFTYCYWPERDEPPKKTAERMSAFLKGLGRQDAAFGRWFEQAKSLKRALELEFEPAPEALERLLKKNKYALIFSAWNGRSDEEEGCDMRMSRGSLGIVPGRCMLNLRPIGRLWERVGTSTGLAAVMRCMALAWEPEWGISSSHDHWESLSPKPELGEFVGWITYYPRSRGTVPPLPAPVRIEPVEDLGALVILTPERFTLHNPAHVELAARVRELLGRAGLLTPLRK